ncbi:diacylglycerol kinase [Idiomarina fontislapidosi]|uniref:Diacylglycerol kinase n=1 Tax=Idiomarina fontislapidosi TaxID=263723 RepID=A0A432XR83_9GAMM|nr:MULTISPECIES: diacylglycerol kinase [Idiomarina]OIM99111.1 diacylglycerol kinase [Idiomarina sp. MD25a]PYE30864.1 diacylglycerol kinase [Idiomarina fontislapidosi]RUO51226.1 diacylglycerol kinase [Idiomarina fontislapidosi]
MKPSQKGLRRIINANRYSFRGLVAALRSEAAFRQECALLIIIIPTLLFVPSGLIAKLLLIITYGIVLITELLNSAIEAVVDRIGPDFHELSGKAKDIASAAVFISILLMLITWVSILFLAPS